MPRLLHKLDNRGRSLHWMELACYMGWMVEMTNGLGKGGGGRRELNNKEMINSLGKGGVEEEEEGGE